jgi:hypothetical protein
MGQFELVSKGHGFNRLRKKSILRLILGGAALQRCGKCIVLSAALAAEVTLLAWESVFPQPVKPCPTQTH